jgi:RecA/RadA recombinase
MNLELDNQKYFKLLHAMLRDDSSPNDPERSRSVMLWAANKGVSLTRTLTFAQRRLMSMAVGFFRSNQQAPSFAILNERVNAADKGDDMAALLKEYKDSGEFPEFTAHDAEPLFQDISSEWKRAQFTQMLHEALAINTSGIPGDPKKKTEDMRGPDDARMYLMKEMQSGMFVPEFANQGGSMADVADQLTEDYARNKDAARNQSLVIPTGIPVLDEHIGGMRRGTLNLILGTAGQRKSALARTIAYNAACANFRVLFIPLEINFKDELANFGIIHSQNSEYFHNPPEISVKRFQDGKLTEAEEAVLQDVVDDLKESLSDKLIIRQLADTTWENIRSTIEIENFIRPVDLVVIDYIGLVDTRQHRDKTLAINDIAVQMKQMALHFPNGRGGLAIVTPAQGSRAGYNEAKANDGAWEKTGIYMYSELEKSADIIFYTYYPIELQMNGNIKIGTCKSRSSPDAPCQFASIDRNNGYIGMDQRMSPKPENLAARTSKDASLTGVYEGAS